jgi:hypothetical protein
VPYSPYNEKLSELYPASDIIADVYGLDAIPSRHVMDISGDSKYRSYISKQMIY